MSKDLGIISAIVGLFIALGAFVWSKIQRLKIKSYYKGVDEQRLAQSIAATSEQEKQLKFAQQAKDRIEASKVVVRETLHGTAIENQATSIEKLPEREAILEARRNLLKKS